MIGVWRRNGKTVWPIGIRDLVLENRRGQDVKLHEEENNTIIIIVT